MVLAVASGLALLVIAQLVLYYAPGGGWFGYAPQSAALLNARFPRFGDGMSTVIALGFIGLWVTISFWLLRDREP